MRPAMLTESYGTPLQGTYRATGLISTGESCVKLSCANLRSLHTGGTLGSFACPSLCKEGLATSSDPRLAFLARCG